MGNPYFKTTKGYNAEVIVAKSGAYSTAANLGAFVDSATEGTVAVIVAATNAVAPANAALAVGTKVFIVQKRDGAIHKSSIFEVGKDNGKLTGYVAPVKQKVTLTPIAEAKHLEIAIIETTVGNRAVDHTWTFDEPVTGTLADALAKIAAKIGNKDTPENYAFGVVANGSVATNKLVIESIDGDRTFEVALRNGFSGKVTNSAGNAGIGTAEKVREIEKEGHIYDGVTTNYVAGMINPSEMGEASSFVVAGTTYETLLLNPTLTEKSPLPFHEHQHFLYIYLALPVGGANSTAIKTILGYVAPAG